MDSRSAEDGFYVVELLAYSLGMPDGAVTVGEDGGGECRALFPLILIIVSPNDKTKGIGLGSIACRNAYPFSEILRWV